MSNTYGWKFILDDTTDITDKVRSFNITSSLESYCRELTFDTSDELFYDTLDFSIIPEEPRVEVFTSVETMEIIPPDVDYLILHFEGDDGATSWTEEAADLLPTSWTEGCEIDTDQFYGGASSLLLNAGGSILMYSMPTFLGLNDYVLTFAFRYDGEFTENGEEIGVAFVNNEERGTYFLIHNAVGTIMTVIESISTYTPTPIIQYGEVNSYVKDVWHTCKFEVVGRIVTVTIDEVIVATGTADIDDPFTDVAYPIWINMSTCNMWVDDIHLTSNDTIFTEDYNHIALNFEEGYADIVQGLDPSYNSGGFDIDDASSKFGTVCLWPGTQSINNLDYTLPRLILKDFTWHGWMKITGISAWETAAEGWAAIFLLRGESSYIEFVLVGGSPITFYRYAQNSQGYDIVYEDGIANPFIEDTWQHVAVVAHGRDLVYFIDGIKQETWTASFDNPLAGINTSSFYTNVIPDGVEIRYDAFELVNYAMWIEDFIPPTIAPPTTPPEPEPEFGPVWVSQGKFFIERPTFQVGINETATGIWGRQSTAILGEPFAQKITQIWDTTTTFYSICQEVVESVGLTWVDANCDIQDFNIYADNFEADDIYPIDVLRKLVTLIIGAEGFVASDRLGDICIKRLDRHPLTHDYDVTDLVVQSIQEEPEWPEFGNRIKIIPNPTVSQNSIELLIERECIGTGAVNYIEMYAQVKDGAGVPIDNIVVDWFFDPPLPRNLWFKYPWFPGDMQKVSSQNTGRLLISNERQKATGTNSVRTTFRVDILIGVWALADNGRTKNFAPEGGYVIDENDAKNIFLTEESFSFCDQSVVISYYSSGIVKNTLVYSEEVYEDPDADTLYGSINVVASVSGKEASKVVYVDNSCKCPSTLSVLADPSTINYRPPYLYNTLTNIAEIFAFLENSGEGISGKIRMTETTGNATLQWAEMMTSTIFIEMEQTEAINSIPGVSQCTISGNAESVVGVWLKSMAAQEAYDSYKAVIDRWEAIGIDVNQVYYNHLARFLALAQIATKTGDNLCNPSAFISGRIIDLLSFVATGTALLVDYNRGGGVKNYLVSVYKGVYQVDSISKVVVSADVNTEVGLSQTMDVAIQGYRAPTPTPTPTITYRISGPTVCVSECNNYRRGTYPTEARIGPYYLIGEEFTNGNLTNSWEDASARLAVVGVGYLQVIGTHYVKYNYTTPTQTFTVTMQGYVNGVGITASLSVAFTQRL